MSEHMLLTVKELAAELKVPVDTIYQWSSKGTGPTSYRVGRYLRFRRVDVDEWLEARTVRPGPA